IEPDPVVVNTALAPETVIVLDENAARLLPEARVTVPLNVKGPNSVPLAPIFKLAVKSGIELRVNESAALPRLMVSEFVGLANVVVSNVELLERICDTPAISAVSSSKKAFDAVGGRLNTRLAIVDPVISTGSRPV